jgi:hypothetical protein
MCFAFIPIPTLNPHTKSPSKRVKAANLKNNTRDFVPKSPVLSNPIRSPILRGRTRTVRLATPLLPQQLPWTGLTSFSIDHKNRDLGSTTHGAPLILAAYPALTGGVPQYRLDLQCDGHTHRVDENLSGAKAERGVNRRQGRAEEQPSLHAGQ